MDVSHRRLLGLAAALVLVVLAVVAGLFLHGWFGDDDTRRHLDVERSDGAFDDSEVVAYENLSPDQRAVFERAVESEDGMVTIPEDVGHDVWVDHRAVRYRGQTYEVAVAVA